MGVRLGIRGQLLAAVGVVLIGVAAVGLAGWRYTSTLATEFTDLYQNNLQAAVQLADAQDALWRLRYGFPQFLVLGAEDRRKIVAEEPQWFKRIDDSLAAYKAGGRTAEEQQALREWEAISTQYRTARPRWFELQLAGQLEEAAAWRAQTTTPYGAGAVAALERLIGLQRLVASQREATVLATARQATVVVFSLSALAMVVGLGACAFLARRLTAPVRSLAAAEGVARGDLDQEIEVRSGDEIGRLADAFRAMVVHLRTLTAELQQASSALTETGGALLAAAAEQSSGATEAAAAIAETTAAVEEVRTSAEQTVRLAEVVTATGHQATRAADEGVAATHSAAEAMADLRQKVQAIADDILTLSEQGQQIGGLITTVNELADQSNLLALNAAIEAARAGEQGKGFAVVAQEIRVLAEQSKGATAQVRTILGDIQRATNAVVLATEQGTKAVNTGDALIERAGRTIGELAETVAQASQSASQIAASVREHSVGMEQIASAMADINQATNTNLASTGETQAAADALVGLAAQLNGLIARYQARPDPSRLHQPPRPATAAAAARQRALEGAVG